MADGRMAQTNKPILDEIAVVTVRDRWSTYPTQGLTPERLARIFKEADAGDIYRQMEMFEEMEEKDAHLSCELQKRKLAVLGLDYEIVPYSSSRTDKKAAQLVQDAMEFEGLEDAILDILDAVGKGFSISEIMWNVTSGTASIDTLKWVPPKRFIFPWTSTGKDDFRLLTEQDPAMGIELPDNKFVIHRYKARSGHPSRAGLLRVCAWMYLFKNYNVKDWVTFAEIYGMPLRLGKYDSSTSPEDKEKLIQAVIQLGTDAAGIINKNTEIEFIEAMKATGVDSIYEALANFCNREMSKAIVGQTLTAEVGSTGSYAASKTHNDVRWDLTKADAKALAESLRRYLFKPLVRFNMGEGPNLPWMKYDLSDPEDMSKTALVYSILIKDCGLPVGKKHVYEKFSIPAPEDGEEVLSPAVAAPPGAPGATATSLKALKAPGDPAPGRQAPPADPQPAIDALADRTREQATAAMQTLLQPVQDLIASGASLEEIQSQLPALYEQMDTTEFEDLLARALFVADLYGRWAAGGN